MVQLVLDCFARVVGMKAASSGVVLKPTKLKLVKSVNLEGQVSAGNITIRDNKPHEG